MCRTGAFCAEDTCSADAGRIFHPKQDIRYTREAGKLIEKKMENWFFDERRTVYQLPKNQIRPVPPSGEGKRWERKRLAVKKIKTIERDKRTIKTGRASEQVVRIPEKVPSRLLEKRSRLQNRQQDQYSDIRADNKYFAQAMHYSMKNEKLLVTGLRQTAQNTRIVSENDFWQALVTHAIKALMEASKREL